MQETGPVGDKPGWIVIARHGEPDKDRTVVIGWEDYVGWWRGYDLAGLKPGQTAPDGLCSAAAQADIVFCSTLQRAIETAGALGGPITPQQDALFVEAPLPPPHWPLRLKPRQWGVLARISWWLGSAQGGESRRQAERRAEAAAATLTSYALRGKNVVLCGHGWFNRMIRPNLLRCGWRCVEDGGDGYWSYRKYVRRR